MRICRICGRELEPDQEKYCSMKCCGRAKAKPSIKKICPGCGEEFETKRKDAKYCSIDCCGKAKAHKTYKKTCLICGTEFETKRKDAKYCCQECTGEAKVKEQPLQTCANCGSTFRKAEHKYLKGTKHKFCNLKCLGEFKAKNTKKEKLSFNCIYCGKLVEKECGTYEAKMFKKRKFCDTSCSNNYRYKGKHRRDDECQEKKEHI